MLFSIWDIIWEIIWDNWTKGRGKKGLMDQHTKGEVFHKGLILATFFTITIVFFFYHKSNTNAKMWLILLIIILIIVMFLFHSE